MPQVGIIGVPLTHLEQLPGIRWKLHNLKQLQRTDAQRFAEQTEVLSARFASNSPPRPPAR